MLSNISIHTGGLDKRGGFGLLGVAEYHGCLGRDGFSCLFNGGNVPFWAIYACAFSSDRKTGIPALRATWRFSGSSITQAVLSCRSHASRNNIS